MTYREKFREDHPARDADLIHYFDCPPGLEYSLECKDIDCSYCWDREMEEVTEDGKETMPR